MERNTDLPLAVTPLRRHTLRLLAVAACLCTVAAHATETTPLQLAVTNDTYQSQQGVWLCLIYREAFRRIGKAVDIVPYPSKRVTALLDAGHIDGELNRVSSYGNGHPARRIVPEPNVSSALIAYGIGQPALPPGFQSLANTPFRVEYRAGVLIAETELSKVVPAAQLSTVSSAPLGLRKLAARRTELYVDTESVVQSLLPAEEFRALGIHPVSVLARTTTHAFLHSRHAQLVPQLAGALVAMKKEGVIERMRVQAAAIPPPRLTGSSLGMQATSGN